MRRARRTVVPALLALVAILSPAAALPVSAQSSAPPTAEPEPEGIALMPKPGTAGVSASGSHYELGVVPVGGTFRGQLIARNLGGETETAQLYGADSIPARGGGFGFTIKDQQPVDVGSWLRITPERVTVGPHQDVPVEFVLTVPVGATPGEHVGGAVLEPVEPASGGAVRIGTRVVVGIYLTVAGAGGEAAPDLAITKLRAPRTGAGICPTVAYTNSGTTVLDPTAEITVRPGFGRPTKTYLAGKVGGVAPGASIEVELPCVKKTPLGRSKVTITLKYPGGSEQASAAVNHWPFTVVAAGSILLLVLLALLWLFFLAKRRDDEGEDEEGAADSGEFAVGHRE